MLAVLPEDPHSFPSTPPATPAPVLESSSGLSRYTRTHMAHTYIDTLTHIERGRYTERPPGMMVAACNFSSQVGTGRPEVQGHVCLHSEYKAIPGYIRLCHKQPKTKQQQHTNKNDKKKCPWSCWSQTLLSSRCGRGNEIGKRMVASVQTIGLFIDQFTSCVFVFSSRDIMLTLALCREF